MIFQLILDQRQLNDLVLIRDLNSTELSDAVDEIKKLDPLPLYPAQLQKTLLSALPTNPEGVDALIRQALSLYGLIGRHNVELDDLFSSLNYSIKQTTPAWSDGEFKKWETNAGLLRDLVSHNSVRVVAKAMNLSYEQSNLFGNARIITDIRPVYDDDGNEIIGAVLGQTLRIHFDNRNKSQSISFAMDLSDVSDLLKQCERALRKASTAKKKLEINQKIRLMIPGSDDDS